jgi:hypothetical protein
MFEREVLQLLILYRLELPSPYSEISRMNNFDYVSIHFISEWFDLTCFVKILIHFKMGDGSSLIPSLVQMMTDPSENQLEPSKTYSSHPSGTFFFPLLVPSNRKSNRFKYDAYLIRLKIWGGSSCNQGPPQNQVCSPFLNILRIHLQQMKHVIITWQTGT